MPDQPKAQRQAPAPSSQATARHEQPLPAWITWASGLSNVVIAVFTIVLGVVAIWQGRVMHRTFVGSNRPKIIVREITIPEASALFDRRHTDPITVSGSFRVTNKGTSPATITLMEAVIFVGRGLPPAANNPCFDQSLRASMGGKMQPGTTTRVEFTPRPITVDERVGLQSEELQLYVIGKIIYLDDLGSARRTGFARRLSGGFKFPIQEDPDYEYVD